MGEGVKYPFPHEGDTEPMGHDTWMYHLQHGAALFYGATEQILSGLMADGWADSPDKAKKVPLSLETSVIDTAKDNVIVMKKRRGRPRVKV